MRKSPAISIARRAIIVLNQIFSRNNDSLRSLNHLPWEHPTPDGFPDETPYWLNPDAMRIRVETAQLAAWALQQALSYPNTAFVLAASLYQSALSTASRIALANLSIEDGLAVLFSLPEFQRR